MEQVYGAGNIGEVYFIQLLHMFWSKHEALGEDSKDTWARVNTNYPITFMLFIKNEEGDSNIVMIEVQVGNVGTLKWPFLTRLWHVNTCFTQIIQSINLKGEVLGYFYTLTSSNQKQKRHTIIKNGLQICKYNKVYTGLVFFCWFNRTYWAHHNKWMHRMDDSTRIFGHSAHHIIVWVFIMKEDLDLII